MANINPLINNFNGGETSPRLDARSDVNKYLSGCRILENMIPFVEGGAMRAPGTYYVAKVKHSDKATRGIGFHFSTIQAYNIEIGEDYFRFYKDNGQIVVAYTAWTNGAASYVLGQLVTEGGSYYRCIVAHTANAVFAVDLTAGKWEGTTGATDLAYEIPHTYTEAELFEIKFAQSADILWMVHPNHQPAKLTRSAHTTWTLTNWAPAANPFNGAGDYPGAIGFFEQRLWTAGTNNKPQTFWGTVSGDYEDMTIAALDDDALSYTIASGKVDKIQWIQGLDALLMGTVGGTWRVSSSTGTGGVTPTDISVKKQSSIGVKNISPEVVGGALLTVTRAGTSVRMSSYSYVNDRWDSDDMTRVSKHIAYGADAAGTGIVNMDYQAEPIPILWAVRADGEILGMTFEDQEEVFAWFRLVTKGSYESVAVIGSEGVEDQVWVIVKRFINGSTVRYVEYFKPHNFYSQIEDAFFLHSGLTFDGGDAVDIDDITKAATPVVSVTAWPATGADPPVDLANGDEVRIVGVVGMTEVNLGLTKAYTVANANKGALTFELSGKVSTDWTAYDSGGTVQIVTNSPSGAGHLENEAVTVLVDGAVESTTPTVSGSGEVTLTNYGNKIHLGLHKASILKPNKPFVTGETGTSRGKRQRISSLVISFYETFGAMVGPDKDNLKVVPFGTGIQPTLFTGDKDFHMGGDWGTEPNVVISQELPLPMTVLAIVPEITIGDS